MLGFPVGLVVVIALCVTIYAIASFVFYCELPCAIGVVSVQKPEPERTKTSKETHEKVEL
jgi:hypothetical protein